MDEDTSPSLFGAAFRDREFLWRREGKESLGPLVELRGRVAFVESDSYAIASACRPSLGLLWR